MLAEVTPGWMTDSHRMIGETARRFAERELAPNDERWRREHRVDPQAWRNAGKVGLLLSDIPEEYGGGGGDFGHDAVIYRSLAWACEFGFTGGRAVHSIVAHYLLACGTEAQKQAWLPRMASGDVVGAIAMTEPGAGSDLKGVTTRAVLQGDHYLLNGAKTYISNALNMGLLVVVAKTDPAAGSKGVSLLLVDVANTPGLRVGRVLEKIGMHSQDTCELFFDDCRIPASQVLGGVEGQGMYQLMAQLPYERAIIGCISDGMMHRALDLTVDYTRNRQAFGQSVFDFQNTRFKLAELATRCRVARSFIDSIVTQRLAGELDSASASMAKWWTTQAYCDLVDECLQLFGGAGYMMEYPIARLYADARVMKIFGGTNEIMKELISRSL